MKILHINSHFPPDTSGGAVYSVKNLVNSLHLNGHEIVVISTNPIGIDRVERNNGVNIYRVGIRNLYWPGGEAQVSRYYGLLKPIWHLIDTFNPWMSDEIDRIIDTEIPDIVHTHTLSGFSATVWKNIKKKGLPLVHTLRDHYLLCPRATMYRRGTNCNKQCFMCKLYAYPRKLLSNYVDIVVGVSNYILDRHLSHNYFCNSKIKTVIYNSYSIAYVKGRNSRPFHQSLVLGYIGMLNQPKGIELLLDQLPKNVELYIAGKGSYAYEKYLKAKYKKSNIVFLGFIDPQELFRKIDVLVYPSLLNEAFGRGIIEAYANGIPVIASKRGGIPEIVEDGVTGCIFDPDNPLSLPTIINYLFEHPYQLKEMKQNALRKSKLFTNEIHAGSYLNIYQSLLNLFLN